MNSNAQPVLLNALLATASVLFAPDQCFALQQNKIVSKEEAKKLGVEIRSSPNGENGIKVWLEFVPKDALKTFTHVDVEIRAGKKCLMFGPLLNSHPTPERVLVHFSSDADNLPAAVLTIVVQKRPETRIGYQFPVKDFIDLQNIGLQVPRQPASASAVSFSKESRELRQHRSEEGRCEFVTVGGRKPVDVPYQAGEGASAARGRLLCFDQPHCRCQVRYVDLPLAAAGFSRAEIATHYGFEHWCKVGKLSRDGTVKTGNHAGEEFVITGLPTKRPVGHATPHSFVRLRVFVDGKRAFIVSGSAPDAMKQEAEREARAFFDSFRIVRS